MIQRLAHFLETGKTGSNHFTAAGLVYGMTEPTGDKRGWKWTVTVMKFGKSSTPPHFVYTKEAAQKSLEVIRGARVYANSEGDLYGHKKDASKKVSRDVVGVLTDPVITDTELQATLNILPSGAWLRDNLIAVFDNNLPVPYELSIDAYGKAYRGTYGTEQLPIAERFDRFDVDVVERGAAGGRIVKMAASHQLSFSETTMKNKLLLLFSLLYPTFLEAKKVDLVLIDENELFTHLLEADKPQPRLNLPDGAQLTETLLDDTLNKIREKIKDSKDAFLESWRAKLDAILPVAPPPDDKTKQKTSDDPTTKFQASLDDTNKRVETMMRTSCATLLNAKLVESKLAKPLQDDIRAQFMEADPDNQGKERVKIYDESSLDGTIKRVRDTYAKFTASLPNNHRADIRVTEEETDKIIAGIDGFFLEGSRIAPLTAEERKTLFKGVPAFRSFKEAYIAYTGDVDVTGEKSRSARLTESLQTGDWAEVVASAMNKRMVREYPMLGLDGWRAIADVVPLKDFKQQRRIRYGGYPNLPIRPQGNPYLPLTSPTDEEAVYTPATRGGTEDITRELIMNDDVGAVQKIPSRMARAAAQTLHEFVFDFIRPGVNPVIYDGDALYHSNHANTGTAALASDGVAFKAARLRMKKQTMKDNNKRLGLRAGILIVPSDLEEIAYVLTMPAAGNANNVPKFEQQLGVRPHVVDYWTDATDWVLAAKPEDIVGLEIGFINGQETPEMFVSDVANVGSWFTNDKITYKIRHEYGGNITDFRSFDGSIVAG